MVRGGWEQGSQKLCEPWGGTPVLPEPLRGLGAASGCLAGPLAAKCPLEGPRPAGGLAGLDGCRWGSGRHMASGPPTSCVCSRLGFQSMSGPGLGVWRLLLRWLPRRGGSTWPLVGYSWGGSPPPPRAQCTHVADRW